MGFRLGAAVALLLLSLLPDAALADRRVALVVANAAYKGVPLENPTVDADLVAATLTKAGFTVDVVKNADLGAFDTAVHNFADHAKGADIALFYFAGHGFAVNDSLKPVSILMSTSADVTAGSERVLRAGGIPLDDIVQQLVGQATSTLIFVDACRNDPRLSRAVGGNGRGLSRLDPVKGGNVMIGLSTRLGDTAADGTAGLGSPFARAFAATIDTPGLRIDDAFRKIRDAVSGETEGKQLPDIVQDDLPDGAIVLAAAPVAASAQVSAIPPAVDAKLAEAAQIWLTLQDSRDPSALEAFAKRYVGTFYADLAIEHRKGLAPPPAPPKAAVGRHLYGVVVGIDKYRAPIPQLNSAVADARDIAEALRKAGAVDVQLKTDELATKSGIEAAWQLQLDRAEPGDVIVFSFAGHGSQEPARPEDPLEPDGLDENLPLVGYTFTGPGLADRLVDNEIATWLTNARAKGVAVVLAVDASHSGTICDQACEFDNVTFLAGAADDRLVPEVEIDGQKRGAMSYAFARALEGAADANGDGIVTRKELIAFVRRSVMEKTDSQQIVQSSAKPSTDDLAFAIAK